MVQWAADSDTWRKKAPQLVPFADETRRLLAGTNTTRDFRPERYVLARATGEQIERDGGFSYRFLELLGFDDIPPGGEISEGEFKLRWLCYAKYGIPFLELLKRRNAGSWDAAKKLLRAYELYEKDNFGKLRESDLPGLTKRAHSAIMRLGLHLGADLLTESELARFYDACCPLCRKHLPENLKKLRQRIRKLGFINRPKTLPPCAETPL